MQLTLFTELYNIGYQNEYNTEWLSVQEKQRFQNSTPLNVSKLFVYSVWFT